MTTWRDFYDNCSEWADSTVLSRISSLKEMGPASEVAEATEYISEKCANALIRKALTLGVVFRPDDIAVLAENGIDSDIPRLLEIALKNKYKFTKDNIETIYENCPFSYEAQIREVDRIQKTGYFAELDAEDDDDDDEDEIDEYDDSYDYADTSGKKPGLLEKLGLFFLVSDASKYAKKRRQKREYSGHSLRETPAKYHIGDRVKVRSRSGEGYIVNVTNRKYDVRMDDGTYLDYINEWDITRVYL